MNRGFIISCFFVVCFGLLIISVIDGVAPAEGNSRISGYVLPEDSQAARSSSATPLEKPDVNFHRLCYSDDPMYACRTYYIEVWTGGEVPADAELEKLCQYLWSDNQAWRGFTVKIYLPGMSVREQSYVTAHFTPDGMWCFEKYSTVTPASHAARWSEMLNIPEDKRDRVYEDFVPKRDVAPDDLSHISYAYYEVARDHGLDESIVRYIVAERFWRELKGG